MTTAVIRPSRSSDLAGLSTLEQAADAVFAQVGLTVITDAPAPDPQTYAPAHEAGRLLVAVDPDDGAVGFVRLDLLDGDPHVEQVSVHPDHAGHGIGAALLTAAEELARNGGHHRITLTTYRDIPWNGPYYGPYYGRLGWTTIPDDACGPELTAARRTGHPDDRHLHVERGRPPSW
ncbi:MAG: GNAT family N-acetyltransferase [Janthinobacterium lividum]